MTMTRGDDPASTAGSATAEAAGAAPAKARERRSHVPGDGSGDGGRGRAGPEGHAPRGPQPEADADRRRRAHGGAHRARAPTSSWSYPGGVILPIYDILGDYPEIRHILVRHEQGGAHAADGYARASGKVGVCMGTSGPGATNLVTGIATAQLDSHPDGRDHRQRAQRPDRQGRVPGDRHHRHHAADDEAQLPGPQRRRHPARRRRGVLPRPQRPARAGPHRHHEGRPPAGDDAPSTPPSTRSSPACRASARRSRATQAAQAGRQRDRRGEAAADPRRPRRPHRRGEGRAQGVRGEDPDPGRVDAARHRRAWTRSTRWPTATWACTAGST